MSKQYRVGRPAAPVRSIREKLAGMPGEAVRFLRNGGRRSGTPFWALRDISLSVAEGEILGIIGPNGSGKTTLLKLLSRITAPTEGTVEVFGRMGTLIEVGTGFHPELTGRENVFLSGAILGMGRGEIAKRFDDIVAFAGVEGFVDTPMKRYSTGMMTRLGFSVAAHLDTDILLIDEILSVGDAAFQQKCLERVDAFAVEGRTVLIVSHNMSLVKRWCTRVVHLDDGRLVADGSPDTVVSSYLKGVSHRPVAQRREENVPPVRVTGLGIGNGADQPADAPIPVSIDLRAEAAVPDGYVSLTLHDEAGVPIAVAEMTERGLVAGSTRHTATFPARLLAAGEYFLSVKALSHACGVLDALDEPVLFSVTEGERRAPIQQVGFIRLSLPWMTSRLTEPDSK